MKAIVEFGIPLFALSDARPCPVDAGIVFPSARKAAEAAAQIAHVLGQGYGARVEDFRLTRDKPRVTWWAGDRNCWVTVSLLDGVARGSFAATVKE